MDATTRKQWQAARAFIGKYTADSVVICRANPAGFEPDLAEAGAGFQKLLDFGRSRNPLQLYLRSNLTWDPLWNRDPLR